MARRVLILGASYGSLLGIKLALAGHDVDLVCRPEEAALINREGIRVRLPVKGLEAPLELGSRNASGRVAALAPEDARPAGYDLVGLAMQEPQYSAAPIRDLLGAIAAAGVPALSIMNMPPPPFLRRIPGLDVDALADCFTAYSVWDAFDPDRVSLCSPDPQAFRPPDAPLNLLVVGLPTNFRAAPFVREADTALLRELQADIEAIRLDGRDLPVKLKVPGSKFVPLAKWAMLLAGNYRCILDTEVIAIRDAVHGDLEASRSVYEWVCDLCVALGAARADLVPFEKYARAALVLLKPSSAARALAAGARDIERVDKLVRQIGAARGRHMDAIDAIVARVDHWLQRNRGG